MKETTKHYLKEQLYGVLAGLAVSTIMMGVIAFLVIAGLGVYEIIKFFQYLNV